MFIFTKCTLIQHEQNSKNLVRKLLANDPCDEKQESPNQYICIRMYF